MLSAETFFAVISTAVPHVQSGKVRGIAVTSARRAEAVPDVPTIAEAGVKGYAAVNWYGLHAPAKTPAHIIERLNRDLVATLKSPDIAQQLRDRGIDATPSSPADIQQISTARPITPSRAKTQTTRSASRTSL